MKSNDETNVADEHNMVKNPNCMVGGRPVGYLQVIRSVVFVATPVQVILAWPAIPSLY